MQKFASQSTADAIVISGDLTQRAKRHQFEAARSSLNSFRTSLELSCPETMMCRSIVCLSESEIRSGCIVS